MIMPNIAARITRLLLLIIGALFIFYLGCTESTEQERLRQYLSSVNAQSQVMTPSSTTPAGVPSLSDEGTRTIGSFNSPSHSIIGGTPRTERGGFCGDGIINGPTEDCDQGAIQNTACRDYGGVAGTVTCQPNCLYDISDCMTPAVDREIGGIAETCKCNCNTTLCRGGCNPTGMTGQSSCRFECDSPCICNCERLLNAQVDDCEFQCVCELDANGNPDCRCNLDNCRLLNTITPNVATIATRRSQAVR